jgi:hypothetical protein
LEFFDHFSEFICELIQREQNNRKHGWQVRIEYLKQQMTIAEAIETAGTDGDATNPLWKHYDEIEKWRDFLIERFPRYAEWLQKFADENPYELVERM